MDHTFPPTLESIPRAHEDEDQASLAERVYTTLLESILAGRVVRGTILSEVAVAKQLNVSRTPVHDALRQLAKDGLVEQATGRRARVAQFTPDDVFEIYEMRKILEGPAAELAAGRMDQRQLGPLRSQAEFLMNSIGHPDWLGRWADFDEEFHHTIAASSGNRRLANDIDRYRLLHRGFNITAFDPAALPQALEEHLRILDALDARNPQAARDAMMAHISHWQRYFVESFRR